MRSLWSLRIFLMASDVLNLYGMSIEANHSSVSDFYAFALVFFVSSSCTRCDRQQLIRGPTSNRRVS